MSISTIIALIVLALLTTFQFALILDAPHGHYAWGGQHKVMPIKLRIGSITAVVIYATFAAFIASKAGL